MREFFRFWGAGMLCLSLTAILALSRSLRPAPRWTRAAAALVIGGGIGADLAARPLAPTSEIATPAELVALAATPSGAGAVYVHPLMRWDSRSCLLMMQAARELRRPFVNGCLGLIPPYFPPAAAALHRFPDPEALWLLRQWRVDTVWDLDGSRAADPSAGVRVLSRQPDGVVWLVFAGATPHPSAATPIAGATARDVWLSTAPVAAPLTVAAPEAGAIVAVDVTFSLRQAVLAAVPGRLDVRAGGAGLDTGLTGQWLQSLAADAFLHRTDATARVQLSTPRRGALQLSWEGGPAPIASVTVWTAR